MEFDQNINNNVNSEYIKETALKVVDLQRTIMKL